MENNDTLQDQLAEALEHNEDHPVTQEEYEIPEHILFEMHLKQLAEKFRKSALLAEHYVKQQEEIWGTADENNK